jgi:hypothetical protein
MTSKDNLEQNMRPLSMQYPLAKSVSSNERPLSNIQQL